MTEELDNEIQETTDSNELTPEVSAKRKKKKKKKLQVKLPQYLLDAQAAGEKATSRRLKTHSQNTPKLLGVEGLDQSLRYRWVDKTTGSGVGMRETQGWAIVMDATLTGPRHSGSSMIDTHDSVLMATTRQNYDELAALAPRKSKARIGQAHASEALEQMRKNSISKKTYETSLQADEQNTIFE